jgi:ABC-type branched-subunit amino acid transport system ATPase component
MSAALSVRGLSAGYGGIRVLDGIDLDVPPGKLTVVVGPNVPARRRCSKRCPV